MIEHMKPEMHKCKEVRPEWVCKIKEDMISEKVRIYVFEQTG